MNAWKIPRFVEHEVYAAINQVVTDVNAPVVTGEAWETLVLVSAYSLYPTYFVSFVGVLVAYQLCAVV